MINLLPPQYKDELRAEEQFRFILILGILLVLFFLCLSLALLSVRVYVWGEISAQEILVDAQRQNTENTEIARIQNLNKEINTVSNFYETRFVISDIVERVEEALPPSAYLTSFIYTPDSSGGKIALRGFALRTEDLLAFRDNLQENPSFSDFRFPPSNWSQATNVNFSFDFSL